MTIAVEIAEGKVEKQSCCIRSRWRIRPSSLVVGWNSGLKDDLAGVEAIAIVEIEGDAECATGGRGLTRFESTGYILTPVTVEVGHDISETTKYAGGTL